MAAIESPKPEKVLCDCCGTEQLAIKRDGKLVITDHRHGKKHFAVVALDKVQKEV